MVYKTKKYKLADLGFLGRGKSKHRPRNDISLFGGKYPFIQTGEIKAANLYISEYEKTYNEKGLAQSKLWNENTLCITIAANIAETAILKIKACFPDSIVGFIANENLCNVYYVKYYIDYIKNKMQSVSGGACQDNLSLDKIDYFDINIPDVKIQNKIAKILLNYDDLIENNNRRIKILEEMAQKIYKEWFVDFKFPGHETTTFKDSPLGKIPNDWEVKLFSDYFDIQNGFAFKSKDYSNNGVKIIRTKDFASTKYINITDPIFLPNQLKSKYETYMLQEYDFLLIMVGASIGKYGIVLKKDMPSLQNQNMWALRPKNNYIYLKNYSIFMFENLIKKVLSFATGAAREFFRKEHFNNQRIIVPNSRVLNLFNQITNDILNEISNLYTKNENLKQTRDILLPRLITGEINVENMEVL